MVTGLVVEMVKVMDGDGEDGTGNGGHSKW